MSVTSALRSASCVASSTAEVDLPTPPLELANTMVGILVPCWMPKAFVNLSKIVRRPTEGPQVAAGQSSIGLRSANGKLSVGLLMTKPPQKAINPPIVIGRLIAGQRFT